MIDAELKADIESIIKQFTQMLQITLNSNVVTTEVKKHYDKGLDDIGTQIGMNFTGKPSRINFLEKYVFENIKGLTEEASDKLRKELSQAFLNLESIEQVKERVMGVMDMTVNRARMIARTETNRAANMGHIDGARESGLKLKKRWDAHLDKRTSPVCRGLDGVTVGVDEKFKYQGEEFDAPPAHPNCRSTLIFIQEDEE